ncbi:type II secretion system F family protein [Virgibacillus siamensis]|uniref:type II secretion system F family protein n=1 Tax=Virgibacillus siamensis TaxID=480071 RepID=UPI0009861172|nr:type II secretion system F family protein [Virgibacillus siamensis]
MLVFYISLFITVSLFLYGVASVFGKEQSLVQQRIDTYLINNQHVAAAAKEADLSFKERIIKPFWIELKRKFRRKLSKEKVSKLEIKLLQAGEPFGMGPVEFKIIQLLLILVLPAVAIMYGLALHLGGAIVLLAAVIGLAVAIQLPNLYLRIKIDKRSRLAIKELPDVLDLLTISLEAGLGFDAAVSQVVKKKKGVLADAFNVTLEEMRLGKTRKNALNDMNNRLQLEELKTLIYSIIQAEKLGIGMVSVLRVQTEDIRERRRQQAEEKAMKAPIKMMFPLVIFIFPTLFIILLGPAILQFMANF